MFGTELERHHKYLWKDVCSGDSGGPLMFYDEAKNKNILIGTVFGFGYNCKKDTVAEVEGSTNGLWNKVSFHVSWIREIAEEMGEELCS